ncbi:hypothetical protein V6Z11_D09G075000 [Gossypium hirsutum]
MSQTGKFHRLLSRWCLTVVSADILKVDHNRREFEMTWTLGRRVNPNCALCVEHPDTTDQHAHIVSMFLANRLVMLDSKMTTEILLSAYSCKNKFALKIEILNIK